VSSPSLPALVVSALSGSERFHSGGRPLGFDVLAFWRWSSSDLAGNAMRGVLAEYIVAQALRLPTTGVRMEWDACDLRLADGTRVEVKSAAYLQSWSQRSHSSISFDIAPKRGWDATTNVSASVVCRSADVYVFALLAHQDKTTLNPLDVSQWRFYVLPARRLDEACPAQKRIGLRPLERLAPPPVEYGGIREAVEAAVQTVTG
jgi:hypothetical protein